MSKEQRSWTRSCIVDRTGSVLGPMVMNNKIRALSIVIAMSLSCAQQVSPTAPSNTPPTPLPPPANTKLIENEGILCFREYENSSIVEGYFRPRGCFSSSCWQLVEKSLTVQVVEEKDQLRFYTRVMLKDFSIINGKQVVCTADCSNVADINFNVSNVPRKKYSVWLGDLKIGEFSNATKTITQTTTCLGRAY